MNSQIYRDLWKDPDLQARIDEGIRLHRQSGATIRIKDFLGNPLPGVRIRVEQHDTPFRFGANIFKLNDYPSGELNRKYEDAYCALFNSATVPFYWRALEPEQGRPRYRAHSVPISRRPPPDTVVEFCNNRGLRMHGHTLAWSHKKWSWPDWLPENPEDCVPFFEKRFRDIGERYGKDIKSWDVVNEAVAAMGDSPDSHAMPRDYERKSFDWAGQCFPDDCRLDINETTYAWDLNDLRYTRLIESLLQRGARIGAIGMQFHIFTDEDLEKALAGDAFFQPKRLLEVLDHYAMFGLPMHVSEITLTAPGNTPEGLEIQAEVARNFYRLWFSHPLVEGITWWNLPDGGAAQGEQKVYSGLLFEDMTPKPSYLALQNLIRKEWRTETSGITDEDGCFHFRGFHGTYRIMTDSGKSDSGIESAVTLEQGKDKETTLYLK